MEEDDEYLGLPGLLEVGRPDTKFEAGDVIKSVDGGLKTESRLAGANKETLSPVLPARDAAVNTVQASGHPPGSLTRLAWLKQKLPPLVYDIRRVSSSSGLRAKEYLHWPDSTKLWDLSRDVEEYLADAATKDSYHDPINIEAEVSTSPLFNEADSVDLYTLLLKKVGLALFGKSFQLHREELLSSPSSSKQQRGETAVTNAIQLASEYYVDMTLYLGSRKFLLLEMERHSFFRNTPRDPIPDLVVAYEHRCDTHADGNRYPVLAQVVNQLFTYMFTSKVSYGVISSGALSYFVWAGSDALYISKGVEWEDEKFVAVLSYFLEKAAKDSTELSGKEEVHVSPQDNESTSEGSDDDPMSDHKDDDFKGPPNSKRKSLLPPTGVTTRSKGKRASGGQQTTVLKEMPAGCLHLESHPFATGWSGNIVRGVYKGVAIAVKLALVGTDRAETLVNEASAYLKLQGCWGTNVPALISYGTTANGRVVYVATEFIVGSELEKGNLTAQVVRSSMRALQVIHSYGVLHGDVRRHNILVPFSGEQGVSFPGVRFVDFGFSRAIATEEDCHRELQQLHGVFREVLAVFDREVLEEAQYERLAPSDCIL